MTGDEEAVRRVRAMSLRQRGSLLRALEMVGASRAVRPLARPERPPSFGAPFTEHTSLTRYVALFESEAWRKMWRPGEDHHLYVVGCEGLGRLAMALGSAMAKVGTCCADALDQRLAALCGQRYGGVVRRAAGYQAEVGWSDWRPFPKLQIGATPPACPVRASARSLIITAPYGWSAGEIEAVVNEALGPSRLHAFADSDVGRILCREREIDPASLIRYSRKGRTVQAATELTLIRAQADTPALAGMIASAIARRLRVLASNPAAAAWRVLDQDLGRLANDLGRYRPNRRTAPDATAALRSATGAGSSSSQTRKLGEIQRPGAALHRPRGEQTSA